MSEHDELNDSVPAWLVGALEPDESGRVGRHVAGCEECQADVVRLRAAAASLGLASPVVDMPAGLKERIVARAAQVTTGGDEGSPPGEGWTARVVQPRRARYRLRLPVEAVAAMVTIALLAGLGAGVIGGRLAAAPPASEVARYQVAGHGTMAGA